VTGTFWPGGCFAQKVPVTFSRGFSPTPAIIPTRDGQHPRHQRNYQQPDVRWGENRRLPLRGERVAHRRIMLGHRELQPKSPPSPAGMICGPLGHEDRRPLAFWGKDIGLTGKKIMDRVSEGNYTRSVPAGRPSPPCHLIGIREGLSVSALSLLWHTYLETARRLHSTPMCALVADLKRRGVVLARLRALDVFGGHGRTQTVDFAAEVASLEAWEVCARKEESLRRNLPNAEIKIVDSFVEIKTTDRKFGFIVVDAPNALRRERRAMRAFRSVRRRDALGGPPGDRRAERHAQGSVGRALEAQANGPGLFRAATSRPAE